MGMRLKYKHARKEARTDLLLGVSREQPDFALARVEQQIDEVKRSGTSQHPGTSESAAGPRGKGEPQIIRLVSGAHGNCDSAKSLQSKWAQIKIYQSLVPKLDLQIPVFKMQGVPAEFLSLLQRLSNCTCNIFL